MRLILRGVKNREWVVRGCEDGCECKNKGKGRGRFGVWRVGREVHFGLCCLAVGG